MMSDKEYNTSNDLFNLFEDFLDPSDVLLSKLMSQTSVAITKERIKRGINQSDFAEYIKASPSLVSRWEQGDYNFSLKKISEIAAALGLDVNISFCNAPLSRVGTAISKEKKLLDAK